jgi:uncharacterized protein YdbL (DUF1318 family)
MTHFRPLLAATLMLIGAGFVFPAFAQTAEELRTNGEACEQADGYMRALSPGAQAAVNEINAQRREFYAMRAEEEGVDVVDVGAVFAEEIRNQPGYRGC